MQQVPESNGGVERRRHIRVPTAFAARLISGAGKEFPGTVKDHCPGGVFIEFEEPTLSALVAELGAEPRDMPMMLQFQVLSDPTTRVVQVHTRVARMQGMGAGMRFDRQAAPESLALLAQTAASVTSSRTLGEGEQSETKPRRLAVEKQSQLVARLRDAASEFLSKKGSDALKEAGERLFVSAREATNNIEQQAWFDATKELEHARAIVESAFYDEIMRQLDALAQGKLPTAAEEGVGVGDGLSLVDSTSFNDWLTVKAIIDRTEKQLDNIEEALAARMSSALNLDIDADSNPCGMRAICFSFHDALQNLALGKRARRAAFDAFESELVAHLDDLRGVLGQLLPEMPPAASRGQSVASRRANSAPPSGGSAHDGEMPVTGTEAHSPYTSPGRLQDDRTSFPGQAAPSPLVGQGAAVPGADEFPELPRLEVHESTDAELPSLWDPNKDGLDTFAWAASSGSPWEDLSSLLLDGTLDSPPGPDWQSQQAPQPAASAHAEPATNRLTPQDMGATGLNPPNEVVPWSTPVPPAPVPGYGIAPAAVDRPAVSSRKVVAPASAWRKVQHDPQRVAQGWHAARNLLALRRQLASRQAPVGATSLEGVDVAAPKISEAVFERLGSPEAAAKIMAGRTTGGLNLRDHVRQFLQTNELDPGSEAGDALDVVSSLLDALLGDELIRGEAKDQIAKLALPLLHTACLERGFLESSSHPAREVLDRIGQLDLSQHSDATGREVAHAVDGIVDEITSKYQAEPEVFESVLPALEELLFEQQQQIGKNLRSLIESKEEQEALIRSLSAERGAAADGAKAGKELAGAAGVVDEEWRDQLLLAKQLPVGQVVTLYPGTARQRPASLAWRAPDNGQFLFAGLDGKKAASFGLQELAMALRRGNVVVTSDSDMKPVERGVYRMLQEMHTAVAREYTHDGITELPNAKLFHEAIEKSVKAAKLDGTCAVACVLELDRFEEILELCGRKGADKLLRQMAKLLSKHAGDRGMVARVGDSRFGMLFPSTATLELEPALERLRAAVESARCVYGGHTIDLSLSVSVSLISEVIADSESMLGVLDGGCTDAVAQGGNCIRVVEADLPDSGAEMPGGTATAAESLSALLAEGRLSLRTQLIKPVGENASAKPYFEILLGYFDRDGELQPVGRLFEFADDETAKAVDRWVVANALDWMSKNRRLTAKMGGLSINLSPAVLGDPDMLDFVINEFQRTDVPPGKVMFELTEATALEHLSVLQDFMRTLREFGCRFTLDDFRAGQASFAYLKGLPVDRVKIDGALVRDMKVGDQECAMVRSVNEIAHFMGKETIAEQVNDPVIMNTLIQLGVDHVQGSCISKPTPIVDLATSLVVAA